MLESKYKTYQAHDYIIFYSFSILLILIYTVALITALYLQQFKLTHAEVFRKNKHGKKNGLNKKAGCKQHRNEQRTTKEASNWQSLDTHKSNTKA